MVDGDAVGREAERLRLEGLLRELVLFGGFYGEPVERFLGRDEVGLLIVSGMWKVKMW